MFKLLIADKVMFVKYEKLSNVFKKTYTNVSGL